MNDRYIFSVSRLNAYLSGLIGRDPVLGSVVVRGEVSDLIQAKSGHVYFTLKEDRKSQIRCVMWRSDAVKQKYPFKSGDTILAAGSVRIYEAGGSYQLYCREIQPEGVGEALLRYQRIRKALEEQGYFDERYKKPIPKYATRIGIVTSPTGAAITDIYRIYQKRNPYVTLFLYPAQVQGERAKYEIAAGIEFLDQFGVDVIIVGRGGGSKEDLWAFNEPEVAEAIFECDTPVISAVGHERDHLISDDVADLRCNAPTDAAAVAIFSYQEFLLRISSSQKSFERCLKEKLSKLSSKEAYYREALKARSPSAKLFSRKQRAAALEDELDAAMRKKIEDLRRREENAGQMRVIMERILNEKVRRLDLLTERFKGLNPLDKLKHGFSYVSDRDGRAVTKIAQVSSGEPVVIHVTDGTILSEVKETRPDG